MPFGSALKKYHIYDSKMMHLMGLPHDFEVKNISQAMMTLLFGSPHGLSLKSTGI
jgi:hypothetical protein